MTRLPIRNHVIGLAAGVAVAVALIAINEVGTSRSISALHDIDQAQQVRAFSGRIYRHMVDAELAQRNFLLTGDALFVTRYESVIALVKEDLSAYDELAHTQQVDSRPVSKLAAAIARKQSEMDLSIRLRQESEVDASYFVATTDEGRQQLDDIRNLLNELIDDSARRMEVSTKAVSDAQMRSRIGLTLATFVGLLAFVLYIRRGRKFDRAQREANTRLEAERDALDEQVRARTAELGELASHLQQAREDERGLLARELHDELGALLTAAKLDVARIKSKTPAEASDVRERLSHLTETLNLGIALKRRIIEDLRPSSLTNLGLKAALEILARELGERAGIRIDTLVEPVVLDENRQLVVYRTVQEALTNVAKYAKAHRVVVRVAGYQSHVEISIDDDGQGFNPLQVPVGTHGLVGMRHRLESVGGRLNVLSRPGQGTRIEAHIPASAPPASLASDDVRVAPSEWVPLAAPLAPAPAAQTARPGDAASPPPPPPAAPAAA